MLYKCSPADIFQPCLIFQLHFFLMTFSSSFMETRDTSASLIRLIVTSAMCFPFNLGHVPWAVGFPEDYKPASLSLGRETRKNNINPDSTKQEVSTVSYDEFC